MEVDKLSAPGGESSVALVPLSETPCTPIERLIVSVPVGVPETVGENVTVTAQLFPAPIDEVQVVVSAKSPVIVTPLLVTAAEPVFVIVTAIPALVVPVACCGNVKLVGETVTEPPVAVPVPVRVTHLRAVQRGIRERKCAGGRPPVAIGVKVTPTVHVAPPAQRSLRTYYWRS